jgi:hypothetical protein
MGERTPRASVMTRIWQVVEQAGRIAFSASDERARARGWDVRETGRWSRSYRDPRFDRYGPCPRCTGADCGRCAGTGRVERQVSFR